MEPRSRGGGRRDVRGAFYVCFARSVRMRPNVAKVAAPALSPRLLHRKGARNSPIPGQYSREPREGYIAEKETTRLSAVPLLLPRCPHGA